jgi:hypothetical protein
LWGGGRTVKRAEDEKYGVSNSYAEHHYRGKCNPTVHRVYVGRNECEMPSDPKRIVGNRIVIRSPTSRVPANEHENYRNQEGEHYGTKY